MLCIREQRAGPPTYGLPLNIKIVMNKSKVNEAVIISAIRASKEGKRVTDICREYGIHRSTFYFWKKRYRQMVEDGRNRLEELEAENARLRQKRRALESNANLILGLLST